MALIGALKKRLAKGGFPQVPIIGLGVTTKSSDEVQADLREAARAGILLLTMDDLAHALQSTLAPVNPERFFEVAGERVNDLAGGWSPA